MLKQPIYYEFNLDARTSPSKLIAISHVDDKYSETLEVAVKQNDRYILGIECDSRLYEISESTRERDYHRQKYLESRGWHIHRVWTPGMYKDTEGEISKIVRAIERAQAKP